MADGRLDEAYDQAVRDDVRQHRRGQRLISRLVDRLVERGQAHVQLGRLEQALADYDRAARLGGNQPRIANMRAEALRALESIAQQRRRRSELIAAAGRHIGRGEITCGARLVEQLGTDDSAAVRLSEDIAAKRAAVEAALARAEQALGRQSYEVAASELLQVKKAQPAHARLAELAGQFTAAVATQVREAIQQGRLDTALSLLAQLKRLTGEDATASELCRPLDECRLALTWLDRGDIHQALRSLIRLGQLVPDVVWIQQTIQQTQQASLCVEAVRNGPLGLIDRTACGEVGVAPSAWANQATTPFREQPTPILPAMPDSDTPPLPSQFLMQVDVPVASWWPVAASPRSGRSARPRAPA